MKLQEYLQYSWVTAQNKAGYKRAKLTFIFYMERSFQEPETKNSSVGEAGEKVSSESTHSMQKAGSTLCLAVLFGGSWKAGTSLNVAVQR